MGAPFLCSPNHVDTAPQFGRVSFSPDVGSWRPEQPLEHLRYRGYDRVAMSWDTALSSTMLLVDLGRLRSNRVLGIPRSTIGRKGRVRVRAYSDASNNALEYDTGWEDYWRTVYPEGTLPFDHPSFLDGKLAPEDVVNTPVPYIHVIPQAVVARYWFWEIDDTSNTDGFVEIPRIYIAPGYQPSYGMALGAGIGWEDLSQKERSLGGAWFADERPGFRVVRFVLPYQLRNEAFAHLFDMQGRLKTTDELFYIGDPDDHFNLHRMSFVGTLRQLSPMEFPVAGRNNVPFEIEEVIA